MNPLPRISCCIAIMASLVLAGCGGGGTLDLGGPTYTIGGTVSGLGAGKRLVLRNNGANDLVVGANGAFTFSGGLNTRAVYSVTVFSHPVGQLCTVAGGSGAVAEANVTNVAVSCVSNAVTIGGTVSGLVAGRTVVLRNNGGDDLAVGTNGAFAFATPVVAGSTYSVSVLTQPTGQACSVGNASGTAAAVNIANITVTCVTVAPVGPAAPVLNPPTFGVKELRFTWAAAAGATFYRLKEDADGTSGYTQVGPDLTALTVNHIIPVHRRLNARYIVEACNAVGCTPSIAQVLTTTLTQAIGYVKPSTTASGQQFGYAVALSSDGTTLAVGAEGEANGGAVYIFVRGATAWAQQARLVASSPSAGDAFGRSVALSGNGDTLVLAVGAPNEDSSVGGATRNESAPNAGAVYVFSRSGASWSPTPVYLKASNIGAGDLFGTAVALSTDGSTLAVGAPNEDSNVSVGTPDNAATDAGAVYVFTSSANWAGAPAYLKASNIGAGDLFGTSVALSGDGNTLAVGAPNEDSSVRTGAINNSASNAGAVYVFSRSGTSWSAPAYLKALTITAGDLFGKSVSLSSAGNLLAVGATGEGGGAGAAYLFNGSGTTWSSPPTYLKASNAEGSDQFGTAVALSGNGAVLAVGAIGEDSSNVGIGGPLTGRASNAGAVYVFTLSAGAGAEKSTVKASNTDSDDAFGHAVALSSDGNTLAVGAIGEDGKSTGISNVPTSNNEASNAGAVYLY